MSGRPSSAPPHSPEGGEVLVDGRTLPIRRRVGAAIAAGVGYVPRERRVEGLVPYLPLRWNASMAILGSLRRLGIPWIDTAAENELVNAQIKLLRIKASDPMQLCTHLSGGNQQKVVLAKWLMRGSRILILQNPTRGIDVGVKEEIYFPDPPFVRRRCGHSPDHGRSARTDRIEPSHSADARGTSRRRTQHSGGCETCRGRVDQAHGVNAFSAPPTEGLA